MGFHPEGVKRAIEVLGSGAALAKAIGVTGQAVSQWRRVPAKRIIDIEKATGGKVTRAMLRPDLYA